MTINSSNGIAVKGKDSAGGAQLAGGQDFVTVGGDLVVLLGDPITPHGLPPHDAPVMAEGTPWFTINGVPVCRAGHNATCGHGSTGRDWVSVTDKSANGAGAS